MSKPYPSDQLEEHANDIEQAAYDTAGWLVARALMLIARVLIAALRLAEQKL